MRLFLTHAIFLFPLVCGAQNLQGYCPNPYALKFSPKEIGNKKSTIGSMEGLGSSSADYVHFSNPYMRSKPENAAYVPAPRFNQDGFFDESAVDPVRYPYYIEGTLYCYYVYAIEDASEFMERLVLASDSNSFHQCVDGRILPDRRNCDNN